MADAFWHGTWAHRGLFAAFAAVLLFVRILPLSTLPSAIPGPNLLLCLTIAWVLRRPEYIPALLIAVVFLLEDMLVMRPPGLWAVIVLLGTEFLRGREPLTRQLPFPLEWAMVAAVILAMTLAYRMVLAITMIDQVSFGAIFLHTVLTILAYPVVVIGSRLALGVRKAATGEVDARGRRL